MAVALYVAKKESFSSVSSTVVYAPNRERRRFVFV